MPLSPEDVGDTSRREGGGGGLGRQIRARKHKGMQDPHDNLTPKQVKTLTALLAGRTVEAAAKEVGVNPATVHRWLNDEAFKAARDAGQRELAEMGLSLLLSLVRNAVAVQAAHLQEHTRVQIRQRASEFVIEHALKWIELEDLRDELERLKALVHDRLGDESPEL